MSISRYLVTAALAASAVAFATPVAYADPVPPWSPESPYYDPAGTLTVTNGDRTETWTWEPGHQSYQSTESNSGSIERDE
jgi:hypothetical protein